MKSNTRFKNNKKGIECLNCKQPLSQRDNFCSNCGQVNDLKPLSIKQYLREFLSGFFAFDTRTLNTIIPLLTKPGKVSKEYISGKRMKYVNPFQLYLHTSIIFFLIVGLFARFDKMDEMLSVKTETIAKKDSINNKSFTISTDYFKKEEPVNQILPVLTQAKLDSLISAQVDLIIKDKRLKKIISSPKKDKQSKIDKFIMGMFFTDIVNLIKNIKEKYKIENQEIINIVNIKERFIKISKEKFKKQNIDYDFTTFSKMSVNDMALSTILRGSLLKKISLFTKCKTKNPVKALDSLKMPKTKMNLFLYVKAKKISKMFSDNGDDLRDDFYNAFTSKISIVLFFILPVFTIFILLFYIRSNFTYTEHLIFVFHLQTVFFILLIFAEILDRIFVTTFFTIGSWLYFIIYLFIAMKKFYQQSKFKTTLKYFLAVVTYSVLTLTGFILLTFLIILL